MSIPLEEERRGQFGSVKMKVLMINLEVLMIMRRKNK